MSVGRSTNGALDVRRNETPALSAIAPEAAWLTRIVACGRSLDERHGMAISCVTFALDHYPNQFGFHLDVLSACRRSGWTKLPRNRHVGSLDLDRGPARMGLAFPIARGTERTSGKLKVVPQ